ncbi:acyl-CoA dehydrogenase family protein [Candidatus Mycolicibacterium alkanivorans]
MVLGAAHRAMTTTIEWARQREAFGAPIATYQGGVVHARRVGHPARHSRRSAIAGSPDDLLAERLIRPSRGARSA